MSFIILFLNMVTLFAYQGQCMTDREKIVLGFSSVLKDTMDGPVVLSKPKGAPTWLQGYFLRHSCRNFGDTSLPNKNYNQLTHFLDCMPMATAFYFEDGQIKFYQRDWNTINDEILDSYGQNMTNSRVFFPTAYTDFDPSRIGDTLKQYVANPKKLKKMPAVSLFDFNGKPVATTEGVSVVLMDLEKFEQLGEYPWKDTNYGLPADVAFLFATPHESVDQDGVNWFAVAYTRFTDATRKKGAVSVGVYKLVDEARVIVGEFTYPSFDLTRCTPQGYPEPDPSFQYMHMISVTENYVILPMGSAVFDICVINTPYPWPYYKRALQWHGDYASRVLVFRKTDGKLVADTAVPPFFSTHVTNSFEEDGKIYFDELTYKNHDIYNKGYLEHYFSQEKEEPQVYFNRFVIDTKNWEIKTHDIRRGAKSYIEGGRINPNYYAKNYTYAYFLVNMFRLNCGAQKVNVVTGKTQSWLAPNTALVSEPVFIPSPEPTSEDDGVLLLQGYTTNYGGKATIYVVDAKTMKEIVHGRAPDMSLFGSHSRFFPYKRTSGTSYKRLRTSG